MEILIAHNFYKQQGGEDQCVAAEVAMLRAHGHRVTQYCISNDMIDTMGRLDLARRTIWSQPAVRELTELFRVHRPQIAHFHNIFPLISPAAYYAARRANIRVVQTVHNFRLACPNALLFRDGHVCEDCLTKFVPWPAIAHRCYRESRVASAAIAATLTAHRAIRTWDTSVDAYIALSEFSRRKLVEAGLPQSKLVIKPNFVFPDPGVGTGSGRYAVFVGRLSAEKGIDTLLEAWSELEGILPLKLIGDGPLSGMVKEAAAKSDSIEWLGPQPPEAVYSLIGEATALVLPSRCYETFGRVIIEAFAKGTPAIVSKFGSMAELVEDGRNGLHFEPGDARDLAGKVRQLISDPAKLVQMRQAARKAFEQRFTADSNYHALMAIYERVTANTAEGEVRGDVSATPGQSIGMIGGAR